MGHRNHILGLSCRYACVCATLSALASCAPPVATLRPAPPFAAVVGPVIIAERGGYLEAPENTVAAVRQAVEAGADWQEIDVTLSRDNEVVAIADDNLERTTSVKRAVAALTWKELRTLRAGAPRLPDATVAQLADLGHATPDFGARFSSETIPGLQQLLAIDNSRLVIDLRKGGGDQPRHTLVEEVIETVRRAEAYDRVAFASRSAELLWEAYNREPSVPLVGVIGQPMEIEAMLVLPVSALVVEKKLVVDAQRAVPAGVAVWCSGVLSADAAQELLERGVHGIITAVPSKVVEVLRKQPDPRIPLSGDLGP